MQKPLPSAARILQQLNPRFWQSRTRLYNDPYCKLQSTEGNCSSSSAGHSCQSSWVDDWLRHYQGCRFTKLRAWFELCRSGVQFYCLEDIAAALNMSLQRLKPIYGPVLKFCYYDENCTKRVSQPNTAAVETLVQIPAVELSLAKIVQNRIVWALRDLADFSGGYPYGAIFRLMHYCALTVQTKPRATVKGPKAKPARPIMPFWQKTPDVEPLLSFGLSPIEFSLKGTRWLVVSRRFGNAVFLKRFTVPMNFAIGNLNDLTRWASAALDGAAIFGMSVRLLGRNHNIAGHRWAWEEIFFLLGDRPSRSAAQNRRCAGFCYRNSRIRSAKHNAEHNRSWRFSFWSAPCLQPQRSFCRVL